jgi:hypothetical protein
LRLHVGGNMRRRELIAEEALEALRASEERLHRSLEAAGLGHWDFDFASGELVWSAQIRKLLARISHTTIRGRQLETSNGLADALLAVPRSVGLRVAAQSES